MEKHAKIVVVGAGSGGITAVAQLLRKRPSLKGDILLIDPAKDHYYQPLWTLVGAGDVEIETTVRPMASLIPEGAAWLQEAAASFDPDKHMVTTREGTVVKYDYLIVAAGLQLNWGAIPGLKETIGKNGVCSNYSFETVSSTWEAIKNFKGGNALFTMPSTPIKCGGAPQKIMYLAEEHFVRSGVRQQSKVKFMTALPNMFAVPRYEKTLNEVVRRKNIEPHFKTELVEIDGPNKVATFENLETHERFTEKFDMIHVTPPMGPMDFLKDSPITDASGWVDVDAKTLRHKRFDNIFALGDCSNLPTSKTGAAIRKQAPVVVDNLLTVIDAGQLLGASYDGYTSCPLITGYGKLVMAEFDYEKQPAESFPIDQSEERLSMFLVKKHFLPVLYWDGMLKGLM
ncbi:FAD/NAD(P)-binding oxidoreductase [Exiguobacterium flavidum]|uniref:FAD/NAD(P)-binding oxidoreductase n=1 Tax=Exiguobacterium flavidum TaxID=2184695 RepID=UPI000DF7D0F8|nr:FAD/NAD(P)-binding oxidoreductase [Exiguobacterium flavidum]